MPVDVSARILAHQALNPDHFLLTLEAPAIARAARPGQFVMLQVHDGRDPLLRRPMSVYDVPRGVRGRVQVLYKVVGQGTRRLAQQPRGARLQTLGPLGNGFRLPEGPRLPEARRLSNARPVAAPPEVLLVAGGIGIAIFPFLADALRRRGVRPTLLFGARSARDLVGLAAFRSRRIPTRVATEDGSRGVKGYVTQLLEPLLRGDGRRPILYVCGPTPMLRAVGALAIAAGAPCQLALESQMPCGIGVCLGCVVACPTEAGIGGAGTGGAGAVAYRRVCTEGPIFEAAAVRL